MSQQTCGARFRLEAVQEFGTREARALFRKTQRLNGNSAANDRIHGLVNHTHRAASKLTLDFVTSGFGQRDHINAIGNRFRDLSLRCGHECTADTTTPYLRQYPVRFLWVNPTGVPVLRTRQVPLYQLETTLLNVDSLQILVAICCAPRYRERNVVSLLRTNQKTSSPGGLRAQRKKAC